MRIQGICIILLVLGAFCLLGDAGANRFGRSDGNDEAIPGVLSLGADDNSALQVQKPLKEGAEMKKKSTAATDFKPKDETKYQKPKDIKSEEKLKSFMLTTTNEPSIFLPTVRPSQKENISGNGSISPFLLRGEPITENASRARALNITAPEPTNSLHANLTDLSDVSMDDEDKEMEDELPGSENATDSPNHPTFVPPKSSCRDGTKTYGIGDKVPRGCEEMCVCGEGGVVQDCKPRCVSPSFRAGRGNQDPLCEEHHLDTDGCCATLVCADSAPEPEESCIFGNKSLARGQKVEDGCSQVCLCEAGGILKCQPRCPPNDTSSGIKQHDRCVALPDPRDSCCTITLCDVSLGEHEIKSENAADLTVNIADVKVLNSTAIKLKLLSELSNGAAVEISENSHVWRQQKPDKDGVLSNLEPAHSYYVRIAEGPRTGPAIRVILPAEVIKTNITEKMDKTSCFHRGKYHKIGAEWYDECISFCMCSEGPKTECVTIECPTDFGLDVLDPHCLDWETVPPDFVPKEPQCCPQQVRCRNNGSCDYEGRTYDNWSEIPSNVTGCEKRCYCEMGKVACQAACPPVTALPPPTLQCPTNQAILMKLPGDDCCSHWVCDTTHITSGVASTPSVPGVPILKPSNSPSFPSPQDTEKTTTIISPTTTHYHPDSHPLIPYYNGPYNPDFKPTESSIEEIFGLSTHAPERSNHVKDKSKSKSDTKKPVEPLKPHKEVPEQQVHNFPGPLVPGKFPTTKDPSSLSQKNPNKPEKNTEPQFVPLDHNNPPEYSFSPSNGENIPPTHFDPNHFDNSEVGPPYISTNGSKKKIPQGIDSFVDDFKGKSPGKGKSGQRKPEQEILPDDLLHLINLHHPGLTQLDHPPAQGHPGLYEFHQQISNQGESPGNQIQPNYFNPPGDNKKPRPQIVAHKNENGETTYHIHTSEVPNSPHQIEELLAHISQHDSNLGPFQQYPNAPAIVHNYHNGPPPPPRIGPQLTNSGVVTHLNHPFSQSGGANRFPGGFPIHGIGGYPDKMSQSSSDEIVIKAVEPLDDRTVRVVFTVPPVLVGLHGRVELRYTSEKSNHDPSTWKSQIFIPPHDLIETPQMEFDLDTLEPATEYKVRVTVNLKDIANSPSSRIYTVTTLEKHDQQTTLPPQIPIDAELQVIETNSSWVNVMWKKFTEYEMQFVDGVQLRYKEHDGKVYAATPLIHRAVTSYIIENLKPATVYEIGISIIPFPGQTTELISDKTVEIITAVEPDPYSFEVKVEIKTVKSQDVEVTWSGVPYPEDKYVNIYRAIYQSDSGKEDTSTFKIAKRDSPAKTLISDLKPGTRYRLWLEVYLTNGRIKKSNVQDFVTKPGVVLQAGVSHQGKLASIPLHEGDYYGPLVIVAILASLSILSTLILLMMLMKRRSSSKADISPRKTTSAYDNPSYKTCEDAVTITNGHNKATEHEMSTINSNNTNNTNTKETV
ncbi:putative epidermal cell surface receptor isoform X2 [Fopius arisanus]|uniref:Epidermal cell surface receptor isoform X2 n=1 Tax=Fopius arisanus TaxID=64838 RepID=A0A9R1TCL6_9HYME|nr:PREDICTED: putative epidermal cell surface receptor isoform X2 [Fopius arisanus]